MFGPDHDGKLAELRQAQIALAQAWARSEADEADGEAIFFDETRLRQSYNYLALTKGLVYPTYYYGLFADLRVVLSDAVQEARRFIRRPVKLKSVTLDEFDALLQRTYEGQTGASAALAEGLEEDPFGAASRAVGRVAKEAEAAGLAPELKLTACFSDGETLWALRHASDDLAPTLYTAETPSGGRCLVSEPFDRSKSGWQAVPPESFVAIRPDGITLRPFVPASFRLARIA